MKIKARLIAEQVSSNSIEAKSLFEKSRFGEKSGEKIIYSLPEAFYLLEENKMQILDSNDKELKEREIQSKFIKIDKKFNLRYSVYKDLRKKGYIPKTALKFGAEFRIYENSSNFDKSHSKWICFPVLENSKISWQDFSAKNRIAHSIKKKLLIGIIDEEGSVSYFEVNWKRL